MDGLDSLRSDLTSKKSANYIVVVRAITTIPQIQRITLKTSTLTHMILNCYTCGKSVSSKLNLCLYCKAETASMETGPVVTPATQREKRKGLTAAFLSLVLG